MNQSRRRLLLSGLAFGAILTPAVTARLLFGSGSSEVKAQTSARRRERASVFEFMTPAQIADVQRNAARLDVTAACRAALAAASHVVFPAGTYLVDAAPGACLAPTSNQRISLEPGAVLQARGNSLELSSVIRLENVDNVIIEGGTIRGERASHRGTTGEHGMGIALYESSNITIRGVTCSDCWGDGIYVGGKGLTGSSSNVTIEDCICENNRRQGMTIAAVDGCRVTGGRFIKTNGIAPAAGIDIEPNHGAVAGVSVLKAGATGVVIEGADCSDNEGHGIAVSQVHTSNVRIVDVTAHRNGESGIACAYVGMDVQIVGGSYLDNGMHGISVRGDPAYISKGMHVARVTCSRNGQNGIFFGLNVDGFSVEGGTVSHNGQNGILCDGAGGSVCDNGVIRGVFVHSNSQSANAAYDNIRIGALCHNLRIEENDCKQGSEPNKPGYGIFVTSDEDALIVRNDLHSAGVRGNYRSRGGRKVRAVDNAGVA